MTMPAQHTTLSGEATSVPSSSRTSVCGSERSASAAREAGSESITSELGSWRWIARARVSLYMSGVLANKIRIVLPLAVEKLPPEKSTDVGPPGWPERPPGRPCSGSVHQRVSRSWSSANKWAERCNLFTLRGTFARGLHSSLETSHAEIQPSEGAFLAAPAPVRTPSYASRVVTEYPTPPVISGYRAGTARCSGPSVVH